MLAVEPSVAGAFQDIRTTVHDLCARFPGEYWRDLNHERIYPSAFVEALTKAGFLAALIPEEYGGSGLGAGCVYRKPLPVMISDLTGRIPCS
jgi:alkylation response protein AidB-like acyl-CoA dehydrogenase